MDQFIQINAIAITIILLAFILVALFFRRMAEISGESKQFNMPDPVPLTGVDIPILGTYGIIKGLGFLSISENTLNPRLTLYDHRLDYRVFVPKNADYSQIESVQRASFLFLHYIKISFHDRGLALGVRFADPEITLKIADFFHNRGIPVKGRPY